MNRKKKELRARRRPGNVRSAALLTVLLLIVSWNAGCATRLQRFGAPDVAPPPLETQEDIYRLLSRNYGDLDGIKASGTIEFRQLGEETWRSASIVLLAQRPDRMRVRAFRLFAPTLFEFVSSGCNSWLFVPAEKTAYYDDDCGIITKGDNHLVMSAETVVAALLVISDFDALSLCSVFASQEANILRLSLMNPQSLDREIWIDQVTGLVTKQFFVAPGGAIEAEIRYLQHAARGDCIVPVEVEVILPPAQAAMRLHLEEVDPNPEFPREAFSFSPPPSARIVDVDELR